MNKKIEITKKYYDKNAQRWCDSKPNSFVHEVQFREFIKHFKKGNKILDIGCAYGIHVPLFLGIGRELKYEGTDISRHMLKIAKSRYPQLPFLYGDVSDKKLLRNKKYDGFWAVAVLMHIPEEKREDMFSNLEKLTKRGGVGYITVPNERPHPASKKDQRHFSLYNKSDFKNLILKRNWKVLRSGVLDGSSKKGIWNWFIIQLPE